MTISNIKYSLAVGLLTLSCAIFAQDKKDEKKQEPAKGTITEEIEVVRPYKPILAEAVKIRRSPDLDNHKPFKPELTYTILDKKLELNSNIKELQAQKLADEAQMALQNNYLKIGAGNLNSGLGELYLNTGSDEALQAGLFIKHLSQSGSLNQQKYSNQQISAFGRSIGDQLTFTGKMGFNRRSSFFYGFDTDFAIPAAEPEKQRYNLFEAEGEMMNNFTEDSSPFNYAVKAQGYILGNAFEGKERSVALSGFVNKAFNNLNFGLATVADFTKSQDIQYDLSNHIFRLNPYVKFQGNGFLLNLGLNVVQEFGDNSRFSVLPAVSAEIPIATEYAVLFAGLKGDINRNTLKGFADENFYLNENIALKNSVEKTNIYAGVKGNAGSGFGFKAMAFYKKIEDMALFVNNPLKVNKFDVIYDNGKSKVLGFEGEINIKTSDIFEITGKAQAATYNMSNEEEAWFKPAISVSSNARVKISPKFTFDAEVFLSGESKAKTTLFTPLPQEQTVTVKGFTDLSAGAEYRINNKIGIYLRANNILGNNYQQYLYYPKLGLSVLGGFNFSF